MSLQSGTGVPRADCIRRREVGGIGCNEIPNVISAAELILIR